MNQFVWFENSKVGVNLDRVIDFALKGEPQRLEFGFHDERGRVIRDQEDIDNFMRNVAQIGRRTGVVPA